MTAAFGRNAVIGSLMLVVLGGTLYAAIRDTAEEPAEAVSHHAPRDAHAGHDMGGVAVTGNGTVTIPVEAIRDLGFLTVPAEIGAVRHAIRTTGHVRWDETRLTTITPRISGFVERLHVNTTGQPVRRGQPVLEIYSPELLAAQEELLAAVRLDRRLAGSTAPGVVDRSLRLTEAARQKLRLWDISDAQIAGIERSGSTRRTLTLYAPSSGFVTEKLVQEGQAVSAGMPLYQLADPSAVWVEADVFEQDLRFVRVNDVAQVELAAVPGGSVAGRVSYIYPDVQQETRTARIRIVLPNADGTIKPGMFATVHMENVISERAVLVPRDAVMRTGARDLVFVELKPGTFEPRAVQIGAETEGRLMVLAGVSAGERVVARANFLLDAESRLMESMGDIPGMSH